MIIKMRVRKIITKFEANAKIKKCLCWVRSVVMLSVVAPYLKTSSMRSDSFLESGYKVPNKLAYLSLVDIYTLRVTTQVLNKNNLVFP
jgi:hypothetical protein